MSSGISGGTTSGSTITARPAAPMMPRCGSGVRTMSSPATGRRHGRRRNHRLLGLVHLSLVTLLLLLVLLAGADPVLSRVTEADEQDGGGGRGEDGTSIAAVAASSAGDDSSPTVSMPKNPRRNRKLHRRGSKEIEGGGDGHPAKSRRKERRRAGARLPFGGRNGRGLGSSSSSSSSSSSHSSSSSSSSSHTSISHAHKYLYSHGSSSHGRYRSHKTSYNPMIPCSRVTSVSEKSRFGESSWSSSDTRCRPQDYDPNKHNFEQEGGHHDYDYSSDSIPVRPTFPQQGRPTMRPTVFIPGGGGQLPPTFPTFPTPTTPGQDTRPPRPPAFAPTTPTNPTFPTDPTFPTFPTMRPTFARQPVQNQNPFDPQQRPPAFAPTPGTTTARPTFVAVQNPRPPLRPPTPNGPTPITPNTNPTAAPSVTCEAQDCDRPPRRWDLEVS